MLQWDASKRPELREVRYVFECPDNENEASRRWFANAAREERAANQATFKVIGKVV